MIISPSSSIEYLFRANTDPSSSQTIPHSLPQSLLSSRELALHDRNSTRLLQRISYSFTEASLVTAAVIGVASLFLSIFSKKRDHAIAFGGMTLITASTYLHLQKVKSKLQEPQGLMRDVSTQISTPPGGDH